MASLNKVILIGNLGRDPEVRYLPNGDAACTLSLATSEQWKDKNTGERKEAVEWHNLSFYGRLAEIAGEYLKKGSSIYVEGSLRTRKWQDKDGSDRYTTEIRVAEMKMLGGREGGGGNQGGNQGGNSQGYQQAPRNQGGQQNQGNPPRKFDDFEDDIPFN